MCYYLTGLYLQLLNGYIVYRLSKYDFSSSDIMQEVPIKVHNSHLVHGFLYELREEKSMACEFDRLHVEPAPYLEKTIGILSGCIDEYAGEQRYSSTLTFTTPSLVFMSCIYTYVLCWYVANYNSINVN
jgi:hypothetical protein